MRTKDLESLAGRRGQQTTVMGKMTLAKTKKSAKEPKSMNVKTAVCLRKQKHVEGVQAGVETAAKQSAKEKRLARRAEVDQEQSQKIQELEDEGDDDNNDIIVDDHPEIGLEIADLRVMVEGLAARLVETHNIILMSFTSKVETLLMKGRTEIKDEDCVIMEEGKDCGSAEALWSKNDVIFMRNVNATGSNFSVSSM